MTNDIDSKGWVRFTDTAKKVGQFVGIIGGGGGGFAALAFGIGYLATKAYNQMLGLPTTTTEYDTYVRVGSLFFVNSIHSLATYLVSIKNDLQDFTIANWIYIIVVVAALLLVAISLRIFRTTIRELTDRFRGSFIRLSKNAVVLLLIQLVVILFAFSNLSDYVAPLHPINKGLIFPQEIDKTILDAVYIAARDINSLLMTQRGGWQIDREYGSQVAVVLLTLALVLFLIHWHRTIWHSFQQTDEDKRNSFQSIVLSIGAWIARPVLIVTIISMVFTLPANYGILVMESSLICGTVRAGAKADDNADSKPGFILSDLETDDEPIIILSPGLHDRIFYHYIIPRERVHHIELIECASSTIRLPVDANKTQ